MKHHSVLTLVELRSGEVRLTQQKFKEDYCNEHRGQVFWFFCKTCTVPICRDCTIVEHPTGTHNVVKLDAVVSDQKDEIGKLVRLCKAFKYGIDMAVENTQSSRNSLDDFCINATKEIKTAKGQVAEAMLLALEKEEAELLKSISELKTLKEKALSAYEEELQMLQSRFNTALEMADKVLSEGSSCDVAAAYKPLTTTLKQLGKLKNPTFPIGKIKFTKQSSLNTSNSFIGKIEATGVKNRNVQQWNGQWKMVTKFGDSGAEKLVDARGIAINQDGDVAVADYGSERVCIYSICDGKMKMTINTRQYNSHKSYPHDVVSCQEKYVLTDHQKLFPTIYDKSGNYRHYIRTKNKTLNAGVTVNSKQQIIAGLRNCKYIGVFNMSDGRLVSEIDSPLCAQYIAVSSNDDNIIISTDGLSGSQIINSQGQTIHVLRSPGARSWIPTGVCTIGKGEDEEVFICNRGLPRGVYRFSLSTGKYLGCVTTDVEEPHGIAFTDDEKLVVADKTCVKVFAPCDK